MKSPRNLPTAFDFGAFASGAIVGRRALFLDYDGTLADFHIDRRKAVPSPEMRRLLIHLSSIEDSHVAIISGRTVQDLRNLLGDAVQLEMWGDYGWERWRPGERVTIWSAPTKDAVIFMRAAELALLYLDRQNIEIKTASVAVHTRALSESDRDHVSTAITQLWAPLAMAHGLQILPFNGGLELRDELRTKGTAVREMRDELAVNTHICYLGDDVADEDAFVEVGGPNWSILVAPMERPSYARFWMRPGADVIRFLRHWIHWEGGGHDVSDRFSQQCFSRSK